MLVTLANYRTSECRQKMMGREQDDGTSEHNKVHRLNDVTKIRTDRSLKGQS